jgi:SAM-dependent methyltransferase
MYERARRADTGTGLSSAQPVTSGEQEDVPPGEDFHDEAAAAAWADAALRKRPWRPLIFDLFVTAVHESRSAGPCILELGSGPGFLAEHVLDRCPSVARYTLLDFATPMLRQSQQRLGRHQARTAFVQADFKSDSWPGEVGGPIDLVFSMQAVHELRHKRHAPRLYRQIRALLRPGAELVVCDHLPEGAPTPQHRRLLMTTSENLAALADSGFPDPRLVWSEHNMALYRARV